MYQVIIVFTGPALYRFPSFWATLFFSLIDKEKLLPPKVPDHPHEHDQVFTNPNEACERYQYISLPLQPAKVTNIKDINDGLIEKEI